MLEATRSHGGIENSLPGPWTLPFEKTNAGYARTWPQNLAVLRQIALNLPKRESGLKRGLQGKRLKAGGVEDYLLNVLLA